MHATIISASNILHTHKQSTSYRISEIVKSALIQNEVTADILDLRDYNLSPCIGYGKCIDTRRCCCDNDFNEIYNKLVDSDSIFFVSPHYASIPAKLSMLLEKME